MDNMQPLQTPWDILTDQCERLQAGFGNPTDPAFSLTTQTITLASAMAEQLGKRGQGHLAMVQMNPAIGDLQGNGRKIMAYTHLAEQLGVDVVVFPELALMGYPPGDIIERHPFLVAENLKWLKAIAANTHQTAAIVGFVEPVHPDTLERRPGKSYFNSAAILQHGQVQFIVRKKLLPSYSEFYDERTFRPGPSLEAHPCHCLNVIHQTPNFLIHGHRYGISICEDLWNDADFWANRLYPDDPIAEMMAAQQPEVHINVSASPSRNRKAAMKQALLSHTAQKYSTPLVYVNQVGAVDEISFEGESQVYDASGKAIGHGKAFCEQLILTNPFQGKSTCTNTLDHYPLPNTEIKYFDPGHTSDLERTYHSLVQGIQDYFQKTGFQRAVLGLSGGLDSSVTAALLVAALGADNVVGVSMPSEITAHQSTQDAEILAKQLGVLLLEIPIEDLMTSFQTSVFQKIKASALNNHWPKPTGPSYALDNIQAMGRASILRVIGNEYNALPIATSDKSEFYLGYTTVNGDMSGALAPLGDVPKTKVRALASWLNRQAIQDGKMTGIIPQQVLEKPSGAELALDPKTGKPITAEDVLMPYEFADEVIWRIETLRQSKQAMLTSVFAWEENNPVSSHQKQVWLDRFYRRMTSAVFKWWIAPPAILIGGNGAMTKTDYRHPITASHIDWDGKSDEDIVALLKITIAFPQKASS